MSWNILTTEQELETIREKSSTKPQVIFKHSTRCSISSVIKTRLEKTDTPDNIDFYYLDLLAYRSLSNKISQVFDVYHESPQILLIQNGECTFDESHLGIHMKDIIAAVK